MKQPAQHPPASEAPEASDLEDTPQADHPPLSSARGPRIALGLLLLFSFALQLTFFLSRPLADLARAWLPDDSFYYLLPAWLSQGEAGYSFDGQNQSYGFQPLWMMVLSLLAPLMEDRASFLRGSLVLGSLFHCATAGLLWIWLRKHLGAWPALVAPILWLWNPSLLHMGVSGKETALYTCLLVWVICLGTERLRARVSALAELGWGLLAGLLILTRLNAAAFVLPWWVLTLSLAPLSLDQRVRRGVLTLAGLVVPIAAWAAYAQTQFGTWFPTSGSRKLIGSGATLVLWLEDRMPWLSWGWLVERLPPVEQAIYHGPYARHLPELPFYVQHLLMAPIGWGLRLWLPWNLLDDAARSPRDWLLLPVLLAILLAGGVGLSKSAAIRGRWPVWGLGALAGAAVINAGLDGFLLSEYVAYAFWYQGPEVLLCVTLMALMVVSALHAVQTVTPQGRPLRRFLGVGLLCAVAVINARAFLLFATGTWQPPEAPHPEDAWEGAAWINANLGADVSIGAWNAGMLAYFTEARITNLDGLANSPSFLESVVKPALIAGGGRPLGPTMGLYLERQGIDYLADADSLTRLESGYCFGIISPDRCGVLYRGSRLVDWGGDEGVKQFAIVEIAGGVSEPSDGR